MRGRWAGAPVLEHRTAAKRRILNVPPDVFDLRDRVYSPRLEVLPSALDPVAGVPRSAVLDQLDEGACTGFALAAVVNHLFRRQGREIRVSPRFLYENAQRYDEWRGQDYEGSSIRGAMRGMLKSGACRAEVLRYEPGQKLKRLPPEAVEDAKDKPLGAYFRVTTSSVNDLQSAVNEVGAVLASARVHAGWELDTDGRAEALPVIPWPEGTPLIGGHAFAIVGYNDQGFIVQNSWGPNWGKRGFAVLTYRDWLANRMDAWVAQLGVGKVQDQASIPTAVASSAVRAARVDEAEIHGHYLATQNGDFDVYGDIRSFPEDVQDIVDGIKVAARTGRPVKLMLYAHGGLVDEPSAAGKTREFLRHFGPLGVYPLHFLWHTGFWQEVGDITLARGGPLREPVRGFAGGITGKIQDALDDALEVLARPLGEPVWAEMKRDALRACAGRAGTGGPAFRLLDAIRASKAKVEYHLVGHSAGSILHCHLLDWFERRQVPVATLSFLAPAASTALFCEKAKDRIGTLVKRFALHTMKDADECDDHCGQVGQAEIYHKSLLYLVSHSFEPSEAPRILGLECHFHEDRFGDDRDVDPRLKGWITDPRHCELVFRRPVRQGPGTTLHGSFDDDPPTIQAIGERILGST